MGVVRAGQDHHEPAVEHGADQHRDLLSHRTKLGQRRGHLPAGVEHGDSRRQAVFRAIYTEVGARLQAEAMKLGAVTYLTDEEAAATAATNDSQIDRAWSLWLKAARRRSMLG